MLKKLIPYSVLCVSYIALSALIGEVHPFTRMPMYSYVSNYAYSFYISNEQGKLIPIKDYFNYKADDLTHHFSAICERQNIPYGFGKEDITVLKSVGETMLTQMMHHQRKPIPAHKIQLHRIYYYLQNDSINKTDLMMYETDAQ